MTTKRQERAALAQIKSIITGLGEDSHIGTAPDGVLRYAEENIDNDAAFTALVSETRRPRHTGYASNFTADEYARLAESGEEMTDERAKCLINDEFGFEASRIKIIRNAEVDTTQAGANRLTYKTLPRNPPYRSTDWNYARFNVRGCAGELYFELINGRLHEVCL
jgi:hypothetical protein